ncbi:MAG TPA: hypothetical protein VMT29_10885, partial [Steroidobacteraceae bacterium]|nr:hypothetical protein [Steroidobacteraceae bacterium]
QLYSEAHVRSFLDLMSGRVPAGELQRVLDQTATDAVLLRGWPSPGPIARTLLFSSDWVLAYFNSEYLLFLRGTGPAFERLRELVRDGKDWQPPDGPSVAPYSDASHAVLSLHLSPASAKLARAVLEEAVDRRPQLGQVLDPIITRSLAETAGVAAAADYVMLQMKRVTFDKTLDSWTRSELLATLGESLARLGQRSREESGQPSSSLPGGGASR